jgi:hypothetical protein
MATGVLQCGAECGMTRLPRTRSAPVRPAWVPHVRFSQVSVAALPYAPRTYVRCDLYGAIMVFATCLLAVAYKETVGPAPVGLAISNSIQVGVLACMRVLDTHTRVCVCCVHATHTRVWGGGRRTCDA